VALCRGTEPTFVISKVKRYVLCPDSTPLFFYAVLLSELGKKDQARALLDGLLKKYRQAGPRWRKDQKKWHQLAQAKLKSLPAK